jgi:hypothetical protein
VSGSPGSGLQLLGRELHPAYRLPPHMEYLYSLQHSTANSIHGKPEAEECFSLTSVKFPIECGAEIALDNLRFNFASVSSRLEGTDTQN